MEARYDLNFGKKQQRQQNTINIKYKFNLFYLKELKANRMLWTPDDGGSFKLRARIRLIWDKPDSNNNIKSDKNNSHN